MTAAHHPETPAGRPTTGFQRVAVWLATGLGVGLLVRAPGTIGGLWGLPIALASTWLPDTLWQAAMVSVLGGVGVWLCDTAANALRSSDPQPVVIDEIAALPIVFLGLDDIGLGTLAGGFALFRLFDIAKPGVVKWGERLPGGWGVMADDWLAALHALVVLRLFLWVDRSAGWGFFA
ncbi:MAG: phosphatidylglycerophosphatase A [Planctomycetota bacterium]